MSDYSFITGVFRSILTGYLFTCYICQPCAGCEANLLRLDKAVLVISTYLWQERLQFYVGGCMLVARWQWHRCDNDVTCWRSQETQAVIMWRIGETSWGPHQICAQITWIVLVYLNQRHLCRAHLIGIVSKHYKANPLNFDCPLHISVIEWPVVPHVHLTLTLTAINLQDTMVVT